MSATYETYTGDGVQTNYTIPFPYIARADVRVFVGGAPQVAGADFVFVSASTIQFRTAPTNEALIVIRRISEQDTRVVDFVNGAVLTEADLNTSAKQLFYMIQENRDLLETIINGTFVSVGTTFLDEVAQQVLSTETALEVANRIADIDAAGQLLLDEMMARRVVGEVNDDYTAFILDKDTIIVDEETNETFAQRLSYIGTTLGENSASITELSEVSIELGDDVTALYARYGVTLAVSGVDGEPYITGFAQHNDGTTGTFDILTDKFRVVDPAGGGQNPTAVFAIESGNVLLQNLYLHQLTVGNQGHIKRGKSSAADTTAGFWLGWDGAAGYDFHIGNTTNSLWWDQSAGVLKLRGEFRNDLTTEFTPTWSGFSSAPGGTVTIADHGSHIMLWPSSYSDSLAGTSNANYMAMVNIPLPANVALSSASTCLVGTAFDASGDTFARAILLIQPDGSNSVIFEAPVVSGARVTFDPAGWATSGSKGWGGVIVFALDHDGKY